MIFKHGIQVEPLKQLNCVILWPTIIWLVTFASLFMLSFIKKKKHAGIDLIHAQINACAQTFMNIISSETCILLVGVLHKGLRAMACFSLNYWNENLTNFNKPQHQKIRKVVMQYEKLTDLFQMGIFKKCGTNMWGTCKI